MFLCDCLRCYSYIFKKKQRGKLVTTKLKIKKHGSLWLNYLPRLSSGRERSERSLWLKIRKTSRFYSFVMHSKPKKEALIIASVRFTRSSIENRREEGCVENLAVTQQLANWNFWYIGHIGMLWQLKALLSICMTKYSFQNHKSIFRFSDRQRTWVFRPFQPLSGTGFSRPANFKRKHEWQCFGVSNFTFKLYIHNRPDNLKC